MCRLLGGGVYPCSRRGGVNLQSGRETERGVGGYLQGAVAFIQELLEVVNLDLGAVLLKLGQCYAALCLPDSQILETDPGPSQADVLPRLQDAVALGVGLLERG